MPTVHLTSSHHILNIVSIPAARDCSHLPSQQRLDAAKARSWTPCKGPLWIQNHWKWNSKEWTHKNAWKFVEVKPGKFYLSLSSLRIQYESTHTAHVSNSSHLVLAHGAVCNSLFFVPYPTFPQQPPHQPLQKNMCYVGKYDPGLWRKESLKLLAWDWSHHEYFLRTVGTVGTSRSIYMSRRHSMSKDSFKSFCAICDEVLRSKHWDCILLGFVGLVPPF